MNIGGRFCVKWLPELLAALFLALHGLMWLMLWAGVPMAALPAWMGVWLVRGVRVGLWLWFWVG